MLGTAAVAALLLGGCVVAPPAYGPYGYPAYSEGAPVVVAPPVSIGIGVDGGRGYYGRPYGRPGYYGRGYYGGGRPYWR
jgi:hypothetical protein